MRADNRRKEIVAILSATNKPMSGGALSERLEVSRQIIVQDIALLRAEGYDIIPTHTGYLLKTSPLIERAFKIHHTSEETADELTTIVELGGIVVDVFVWHKVYGKLEAPLNIFSLHGVEQFMADIKSGKSTELMHITAGDHYHTIRADSEASLSKIADALAQKGYLIPED